MFLRALLGFMIYLHCLMAFAHKASDSYLSLGVSAAQVTAQWDIALRDLDYALNLDVNDDSLITWKELRSKREAVSSYAFSHIQISTGGTPCPIKPASYQVDTHTDGAYSVLQFNLDCPKQLVEIEVNYTLFFDLDPQHRGLLRVKYENATHTAVLSPAQNRQKIELARIKPLATFWQYLYEGIWHIWTGYDHILFLLSLLLPAALYRQTGQWHPEIRFRPVLIDVIRIVTAFTIAHSITLSLAILEVISVPSRWIESTIAASVVVAALNNIYPLISKKLWLVAFGFGLIHGLGFANVLKDLGLPQQMLLLSLLAFNLGVEAGQLIIVSAFLPLAYWLRHTQWYRKLFIPVGSFLIAMLAFIWLLERSLDLKLID
ncbi:MAG: HupE/UreJ family protein [Methylococcales bacterium]|nr:HupE/UreJ family protein [Methylococcales bacterium]